MGVGFTCVKHMIPWFHGKSRVGKEQSQVEGNRFHEIEKPGEGGLDVGTVLELLDAAAEQQRGRPKLPGLGDFES